MTDELPSRVAVLEQIASQTLAALTDIRDELRSQRSEFRQEIGSLRDELGTLRTELRDELSALHADMRQDSSALRSELRTELQSVRSEIGAVRRMTSACCSCARIGTSTGCWPLWPPSSASSPTAFIGCDPMRALTGLAVLALFGAVVLGESE
jgi:hypothetical protein